MVDRLPQTLAAVREETGAVIKKDLGLGLPVEHEGVEVVVVIKVAESNPEGVGSPEVLAAFSKGNTLGVLRCGFMCLAARRQ